MASHNGGYIFLLVLLWLTYLATVIVFGLATFDDQANAPFLPILPKLIAQFRTEITKPEWSKYVWIAVFVYQLAWLIYVTTTFGRLDNEKDFVYIVGPVQSWPFYLLTSLTFGQVIAWLVLLEKKLIMTSMVLSWTMSGTGLAALVFALYGLAQHNTDLVKVGLPKEHRLVVGLVHNGLGALVAWLFLTAIEMLAVHFKFIDSFGFGTPSVIATAALFMLVAIYGVFDVGIFEKHTRFLYTPYILIIIALVSVLTDKHTSLVFIFSFIGVVGALATTCVLLLVKLIRGIVEEVRNSAFKTEAEDVDDDYGSIESG